MNKNKLISSMNINIIILVFLTLLIKNCYFSNAICKNSFLDISYKSFDEKDFSVINEDLIDKMQNILITGKLMLYESMKKHTTFKIGGLAKYFVIPGSLEELQGILKLFNMNKMDYFILGNGSNILVGDRGINAVIQINGQKNFTRVSFKNLDNRKVEVTAQAGISMHNLSLACAVESLKGFEFAIDIPGTLGGSVVMNAGLRKDKIYKRFVSAKVLLNDGTIKIFNLEDMKYGHRNSILKGKNNFVLEASFYLEKDKQANIYKKMDEYHYKRYSTQPMHLPSAGCFYISRGYSLRKLYNGTNILDYRVGDIKIYETYVGFFVNLANGTGIQVLKLKNYVDKTLKDKYNITLEPEVIFVGDF